MKPRQYVAIRGGLGNQLFCWSFGQKLQLDGYPVSYAFAAQHGRSRSLTALLDPSDLIAVPDRFWRWGLRMNRLIPKAGVMNDEDDTSSSIFANYSSWHPTFHWGYWQSKTVVDAVAHVRTRVNQRLLKITPDVTRDYVAIHIRRGDYVTNPGAASVLGALPLSYYHGAILEMQSRGLTKFRIVSDDYEWAIRNLGAFAKIEEAGKIGTEISDLAVIAGACAVIMSNSTFSWWGAYLGGPERPVVAPSDWFANGSAPDLYYPHWILRRAGRSA